VTATALPLFGVSSRWSVSPLLILSRAPARPSYQRSFPQQLLPSSQRQQLQQRKTGSPFLTAV
jgi:hypothetical protein